MTDYDLPLTLEKLNSLTPMPLLGVPGLTEGTRRRACEARLSRWQGRWGEPMDISWYFEAEPSVNFGVDFPRDATEAATGVRKAANSLIRDFNSDAVTPQIWNRKVSSGHDTEDLPEWGEAPVRALLRECCDEDTLSQVAEYFAGHDRRISEAYRTAGKPIAVIETPWNAWDQRRVVFDQLIMWQLCGVCEIPPAPCSLAASQLIRNIRLLLPDAPQYALEEGLTQAAKFAALHLAELGSEVTEVPGVGFAVRLDSKGRITAASPGRAKVQMDRRRSTILCRCPGATAVVELEVGDRVTAVKFRKILARAGLVIEESLLTDCLRAGLWERIQIAAT
jgi:hypothetical protein